MIQKGNVCYALVMTRALMFVTSWPNFIKMFLMNLLCIYLIILLCNLISIFVIMLQKQKKTSLRDKIVFNDFSDHFETKNKSK